MSSSSLNSKTNFSLENQENEVMYDTDDNEMNEESLEYPDSENDLNFESVQLAVDDYEEETEEQTVKRGEQEKMQMFWRLIDMGFSRERVSEAIHVKGFKEVSEASEYLISTGNPFSYSLETNAPKEHKFLSSNFTPSQPKTFLKAISREANLLRSCLPEDIYVRTFEDRSDLYSVMMKGPKGTPYEDALFFFDVQLSKNYPEAPPQFHFINYAGSTWYRLNPNLYVGGKVCVSILGTWYGQNVENWDPKNSNLLQVLVSIQGLILVSEPYFNEPGWAPSKGTEYGRKASGKYNEQVLIEVMKSVVGQVQNPPSLFNTEVREHYRDTSEMFIRRLEYWLQLKIEDIKDTNEEWWIIKTIKYYLGFVETNEEDSSQKEEGSVDISEDETVQEHRQNDIGNNTVLGCTVTFSPPDFPLLPVSKSFKSQIVSLMKQFQNTVKNTF